jgi:hypothetical protein
MFLGVMSLSGCLQYGTVRKADNYEVARCQQGCMDGRYACYGKGCSQNFEQCMTSCKHVGEKKDWYIGPLPEGSGDQHDKSQ